MMCDACSLSKGLQTQKCKITARALLEAVVRVSRRRRSARRSAATLATTRKLILCSSPLTRFHSHFYAQTRLPPAITQTDSFIFMHKAVVSVHFNQLKLH